MYIGRTVDPKNRWRQHKESTKRMGPKSMAITKALAKYGCGSFIFEVIAQCKTMIDACETEIALVSQYDTYKHGYNSTPGGDWSGMLGKTASEEHKAKTSAAMKGVPKSDETKANMSKAQKGRTVSDEHKVNLSKSLKGRKAWNEGKKLGPQSEESKRKKSEATKGKSNRGAFPKGNTPWNKLSE